MSALLNHKQQPYVPWKGKTFNQIVSSIQYNTQTKLSSVSGQGYLKQHILFRSDFPTDNNFIFSGNPIVKYNNVLTTEKLIKRPLPLKIYRRELATEPVTNCNPKISTKIDIINSPGGYALNPKTSNMNSAGLANTLDQEDMQIPNNTTEVPGTCSCFTTNGLCLDPATNAKRRVRSAGMIRKNSNQYTSIGGRGITVNGNATNMGETANRCRCGAFIGVPLQDVMTPVKQYYTSTQQYLTSRTKGYDQNNYHNIKSGDASAKPGTNQSLINVYGSNNNIPYCPNAQALFSPVYYKPNNSKFAQEGGVSSSTRITRLKYDTITSNAALLAGPFGPQTANALAYPGPSTTYTLKDKVGYPNIKTPIICKGGVPTVGCVDRTPPSLQIRTLPH
jgi:hypothetical protein